MILIDFFYHIDPAREPVVNNTEGTLPGETAEQKEARLQRTERILAKQDQKLAKQQVRVAIGKRLFPTTTHYKTFIKETGRDGNLEPERHVAHLVSARVRQAVCEVDGRLHLHCWGRINSVDI